MHFLSPSHAMTRRHIALRRGRSQESRAAWHCASAVGKALEVNFEEKALRSKSFMALRVLNVEELLETGLQLTCAVSISGLLWRSGVGLPQQRRILPIGSTRQMPILAKLKISQIRKAMLRTTISLLCVRCDKVLRNHVAILSSKS